MHEPTELSGASAAGKPKFEGFVLSVEAKDNVDAVRKFNALSQGGQCSNLRDTEACDAHHD